jgi:hypothetical protein
MTTRRSSAATQPELPLNGHSSGTRARAPRVGARTGRHFPAAPVGPPARPSRPGRGGIDSSRLDEQTRAIGRQGIAAARAALAATGASDDRAQAGGEGGSAGCAA